MAITVRTNNVWVVEFTGMDLQKLDRLAECRGTDRLESLIHALNLVGAEQQSPTASLQQPQVRF